MGSSNVFRFEPNGLAIAFLGNKPVNPPFAELDMCTFVAGDKVKDTPGFEVTVISEKGAEPNGAVDPDPFPDQLVAGQGNWQVLALDNFPMREVRAPSAQLPAKFEDSVDKGLGVAGFVPALPCHRCGERPWQIRVLQDEQTADFDGGEFQIRKIRMHQFQGSPSRTNALGHRINGERTARENSIARRSFGRAIDARDKIAANGWLAIAIDLSRSDLVFQFVYQKQPVSEQTARRFIRDNVGRLQMTLAERPQVSYLGEISIDPLARIASVVLVQRRPGSVVNGQFPQSFNPSCCSICVVVDRPRKCQFPIRVGDLDRQARGPARKLLLIFCDLLK